MNRFKNASAVATTDITRTPGKVSKVKIKFLDFEFGTKLLAKLPKQYAQINDATNEGNLNENSDAPNNEIELI